MDYAQAIAYLDSCATKEMILGLDAMNQLLDELNRPEKKLNIIHIAGTNGKGSVGAYLTYILSEAGYKVGRYVSPTIIDYRERIQVMDKRSCTFISENSVASKVTFLRTIRKKLADQKTSLPTPFEMETAMALLEFEEQKCDFVLLEAGLGGRLDATNAISNKELEVFTSISMDHMGMLGNTIEEITREKAGILKEHIDAVSYDFGETKQGMAVKKVLEECCVKKDCALVVADNTKLFVKETSWEKTVFSYKNVEYEVNLLGENQPKNAAVAIEAVRALKRHGWNIQEEHILNGLRRTKWSGRFSVVSKNPLLIVDGAHNEDAAYSLKRSLEMYFPNQKLIFIVGIFADKEYEKIIKITSPFAKKIITIESKNPRALPSSQLAEVAKKYCEDVVDKKTVENAIKEIESFKDETIIAFGSLSFLGEIYELFNKGKVEK